MTVQETEQKLRELLGPEFSDEEIAALLREEPELGEGLEGFAARWQALRGEIPPLPADFTARVMERLEAPGLWERFRARWLSLPRLAAAGALAAGLAGVLYLGYFREPALGPPLSVREAAGPEGRKVYFVRFALRQPGAKQVAVAGDFNQWTLAALAPSAEGEGLFTVEVPLAEGTYSYAFVVDGRRWIPDPAADRWVDDGFGQRNSVINL